MSSIKKLAGQTLWYGGSSIAARFVNYLLTPLITYSAVVTTADYGRMGAVYAAMPLLNVIFTYGMETAYFRFVQKKERAEAVNATTTISLLISTVLLTMLLWMNQSWLAKAASVEAYPELIKLTIPIIALDALSAIPFARIRNENRPKFYAFVKIAGILITILFTAFFISYCPAQIKKNPDSWVTLLYDPKVNPINYILIANILQCAFTLLLLVKWLIPKKWSFNAALWKEMMIYALPMLIVGMGGMVNEVFDRLMLGWWLPGTEDFVDGQRGMYNACYKLSILISLFIQAFRMGAEPFFFKQAEEQNPQRTYARVLKFFVITITFMFLIVSLFIPIWKHFIAPKYWPALGVVPILLLANMFLGVYYNLSVWYKVTNRTRAGATITLIGVVITCAINYIFIPKYSYTACAWATFLCYFSMMVISYVWGQKEYRIPYAWKKLVAYFCIVVIFFFIHKGLTALWANTIFSLLIAAILTFVYGWFILLVERKEFQKLPVVGKYIK
ncbi:MAG: polysaccharide biosynthesis C-terminal domain-containing protein [Filimonas sp.]|nr:polysaccharide biosynthesis C-terminal domain-containing protein [Filimonas sp.]